jgi:hypothetical protein
MPQEQARYHTNRVHPDETHAREMDALMDEAIVEAASRVDGRAVTDEAANWLDDIDEAIAEWASTAELAATFVAGYIQRGGE